jgi:uncharacterized protein YbjQ (UPF0145 family)
MMITTTDGIPGQQISRTLGMVQGNTIRARHAGHEIMAELKKIVGGELTEYTKLLAEAREQSLDRMRDDAKRLGANAIVGVRFTTSEISDGAAELLVYGTAVIAQEEAA